MKFFSISLLLAAVGSITSASPAARNGTDVVISELLAHFGTVPLAANGARDCESKKTSGLVTDAENCVNHLKSLPTNTDCVTTLRSEGKYWVGEYFISGNVGIYGVGSNPKCSKITLKCHTLADYYQSLINACKINGHIEAAQYLNPNQYELVNPKSCKKNSTDFIIAVLYHNTTSTKRSLF